MFNFNQYSTLKAAGSITSVTQTDGAIVVDYKIFDPATGASLPDGTWSIATADLANVIAQYQDMTASLQALQTDSTPGT